jgi:hypothetical protein
MGHGRAVKNIFRVNWKAGRRRRRRREDPE